MGLLGSSCVIAVMMGDCMLLVIYVQVLSAAGIAISSEQLLLGQMAVHRKTKFATFPFPSRDVTYQTLPGREEFNFPTQGVLGK